MCRQDFDGPAESNESQVVTKAEIRELKKSLKSLQKEAQNREKQQKKLDKMKKKSEKLKEKRKREAERMKLAPKPMAKAGGMETGGTGEDDEELDVVGDNNLVGCFDDEVY